MNEAAKKEVEDMRKQIEAIKTDLVAQRKSLEGIKKDESVVGSLNVELKPNCRYFVNVDPKDKTKSVIYEVPTTSETYKKRAVIKKAIKTGIGKIRSIRKTIAGIRKAATIENKAKSDPEAVKARAELRKKMSEAKKEARRTMDSKAWDKFKNLERQYKEMR